MIAFIEGKIEHLEPGNTVINVQGVGYLIHISLNTYAQIKTLSTARLTTHFHVREDAQVLYGFAKNDEKALFLQLININGVGPNTALTILSYLDPVGLRKAIVSEDVKLIQSVKGIGAKTAQRIILELKDKLAKDPALADSLSNTGTSHNSIRSEALSALAALGLPKVAVEKNIDLIIKSDPSIALEELIRRVLKSN